MPTNRFKTPVIFFSLFVALLSTLFLGSTITLSHISSLTNRDSLRSRFEQTYKSWPGERAFLSTDKPIYNPGETIWFSVFLTDEAKLIQPGLSEIVYVELINPKESIEAKLQIIAQGGKGNGDFQLTGEQVGGLYKIKAYTRWMENSRHAFVKEIQIQELVVPQAKLKLELTRQAYNSGDEVVADFEAIQLNNKALSNTELQYSVLVKGQPTINGTARTDAAGKYQVRFVLPPIPKGDQPVLSVLIYANDGSESVTRAIPVVEKDLLVAFFPEGGDYLLNTPSKIAFKVMKPDSTSADAEGWLVNRQGDKIQYVKTLHRGLGFVEFTPKAGERYSIDWKSPVQTSSTLPEPLERGFSLALISQDDSAATLRVNSPVTENMILVAQMRGKWLWDKPLGSISGESTVRVPLTSWPSGVVQFTLFDSREIARCERLLFVHPERKLNFKISTDKERYQTREKVTLNVRATDDRGIPVPAAVSVGVVNDAILSYANDKQGNILSSLLLEQDLQTKLEDPTFYFGTDIKAKAALDLVMMTYGWRGFTWKKILNQNPDNPPTRPERAILSGKVIDQAENKPFGNAKLTIGNTSVTTDAEGRFRFPFVDLSVATTLKLEKEGMAIQEVPVTQYGEDLTFYYNTYRVFQMADAEMAPMAAMGGAEDKVVVMRKGGAIPARAKNLEMKPQPQKAPGKAKIAKPFAPMPRRPKQMVKDEEVENLRRGVPMEPLKPMPPAYYRARVFPNLPQPKSEKRSDFRSTLFWSGIVDLDNNGRGSFSFYTADDITSYRATVQGIGPDGLIGVGEQTFYTELPLSIFAKLPVEINTGDQLQIPVTLSNKSDKTRSIALSASLSQVLQINSPLPRTISLAPYQSKELILGASALSGKDSAHIKLEIKSEGEADIWERAIRIVPRGFPVSLSFSGREMEKSFHFSIKNLIPGSLSVHATAFPDVTSDLLAGVESILSEPYGCFEQTSMTSYPNVLILNYLRQVNNPNPAFVSRAEDLLEKGYKRLTTFETKEKGYEWFGGTPAHEALTAYGLVQFKEIQKVAPYVDQGMIDRTGAWLLSRRDGKGGFLKSAQALDNFGRASDDITNAYIVYSLAEAGSQQIDAEVEKTCKTALEKKDPYLLALAANTLWLLKKEEKAKEMTAVLLAKQMENGSWEGATHSITYSQGEALTVETTSFATLAILRSGQPDKPKIDRAIQFLCNQRKGKGGFGNTQATIVALKALTAYVVFSKRAAEDGGFKLEANGNIVATAEWKSGTQKPIREISWGKSLKEGDNQVAFRYHKLKDPLPFTIGVDYYTSLPPNDAGAKLALQTRLSTNKILRNKPLQLNVKLTNESDEGRPMTMVVVNIPGGTVVSPVQFKELMASRKVDFYEVRGNTIYLYYRQLAPKEEKNIALTLTPLIKGKFNSSASCTYLYYTAEKKEWAKGLDLTIE